MIIITILLLVFALIIIWLSIKLDRAKSQLDSGPKELQQAKIKLEFAIKSLNATIWEYDVDRNLFWSDSPGSVLAGGKTLEQYLDIHHPDDRKALSRAFDELCRGVIPVLCLEVRLSTPAGGYCWIEIHGLAYNLGEDGRVAQIVGLRRDINEQVLLSEERQNHKERLEEYAMQADLAMKSADVVLWDYDFIKKSFSSPDATSYLHNGVLRDDFLLTVHPDDRDKIVQGLLDYENNVDWLRCKIRLNMPNKGWRDVDLTASVLARDQAGNAIKIAGVRRDITQEVEMTKELIDLRLEAEKSNNLKSAFVANMSHEVRTPLNAIVGFSRLVAKETDEQLQSEYIKIIESNNELLLQLINDILDLSKIEASKLEFVMSDVDINGEIRQLQQMFEMRVAPGVEVNIDIPASDFEVPLLVTDAKRLAQVITNFLSNAVKFTTQGSIKIGYKILDSGTYFYVEDSGQGIKPENIDLVFDRFSKFDNVIPGNGLGLSICKTIVERLGGEIGVESQFGRGSKFWFTVENSLHE